LLYGETGVMDFGLYKSNQITLLATVPLIHSTGAPITGIGYNYQIWNNTMSINKSLKKLKLLTVI